jgi:hypothetical protein
MAVSFGRDREYHRARLIAQASGKRGDLRRARLEQDPSVPAGPREDDWPGQDPAGLAQGFHGAPDPGGRDRKFLAPLALYQLGELEHAFTEQSPPVVRRPLPDDFHVAANAAQAANGQRHSRAVRRGDRHALPRQLRLAVAAMQHGHRPRQHPAYRRVRPLPPGDSVL